MKRHARLNTIGKKPPCAYTREEMAESMHEAEADYVAGRYVLPMNYVLYPYSGECR